MALKCFKKFFSFRSYIKRQLSIGEAPFLYVNAEEKAGALIFQITWIKNKENAKFLYKGDDWYTVPQVEKIRKDTKLHKYLEDIRYKWRNKFYDAIKQENSVDFITRD